MDVERLDDLRELIGEYWCLAFAEGQEGRNTDTTDGAAQKCLSAIESIIREARAAITLPDGSDQNLLELAATFETCIAFLPPAGRRNIGKAVDQLRYKGMTTAEGHVVVTRNEAGQAVAVTRQDDEGRILSVIAEFEPAKGDMGNPISVPDGYVLVPVEPTEEEVRATNEAQQEFFDGNVQSQFFSSGHYMEESIRHALRAVRAAHPEVKP